MSLIQKTGQLNVQNNLIRNVLDPVSTQDAATKNYVDATVASSAFLNSAGGSQTLVNYATGPNLVIKGLSESTGINLSSNSSFITILVDESENFNWTGLHNFDSAVTLDQVSINTTDGQFSVTGSNPVDINITAAVSIDSTTASNFSVTGNNLTLSTITSGNLVLTSAATATLTTVNDLVLNAGGDIDATTNLIRNVVDPVLAQDAATKNYVDTQIASNSIITSAGGSQTLIADSTNLILKGLSEGTGINLSSTSSAVTILVDETENFNWTGLHNFDSAVTLDQVSINTTDGQFAVTGSNAVDINVTGAVSIDSTVASNFTVTGANLTVSTATSGTLNLNSVDDLHLTGGTHIQSTAGTYIGMTAVTSSNFTTTGTAANLSLITSGTNSNIVLNPTGYISVSNKLISNVLDPVSNQDAATKYYVDSIASGLDPKESCRVTTITDISGTYNPSGGSATSGSFTGINTNSTGIFDLGTGVVLTVNDRVLIKNQTDEKQNGIYICLTVGPTGTLQRAGDQDGTPSNEVSGGNFTFIESGVLYQNTGWVLLGTGILTLNVNNLIWTQFSEAGNVTAGDGLTQTGNQFNVGAGNGITVNPNDVAVNQTYNFNWTGTHDFDSAVTLDQTSINTTDGQFNVTGSSGIVFNVSNVIQLTSSATVSVTSGGSGDLVLNSGGDIDVSSNLIRNVVDPVLAQDAATKNYVDTQIASSTSITSAGGSQTLVSDSTNLILKGLSNSTGISLSSDSSSISIFVNEATNFYWTGLHDFNSAVNMDQVSINTTDGAFNITGINPVNININKNTIDVTSTEIRIKALNTTYGWLDLRASDEVDITSLGQYMFIDARGNLDLHGYGIISIGCNLSSPTGIVSFGNMGLINTEIPIGSVRLGSFRELIITSGSNMNINSTGIIYMQSVRNMDLSSNATITLTTVNDLVLNAGGNINASTNLIRNVVDPVLAQDAATKNYVDTQIASNSIITSAGGSQTLVSNGTDLILKGLSNSTGISLSSDSSSISIFVNEATNFYWTGLHDFNSAVNMDQVSINTTDGQFAVTGTNAVDVNVTGAVSIDSTVASNFTVTGANLTLSTVTNGDILLTSADKTQTTANRNVYLDTSSRIIQQKYLNQITITAPATSATICTIQTNATSSYLVTSNITALQTVGTGLGTSASFSISLAFKNYGGTLISVPAGNLTQSVVFADGSASNWTADFVIDATAITVKAVVDGTGTKIFSASTDVTSYLLTNTVL